MLSAAARSLLLGGCAALALSGCVEPISPPPPAPMPAADYGSLLDDVRILSADDMEGRGTGTPGGGGGRGRLGGAAGGAGRRARAVRAAAAVRGDGAFAAGACHLSRGKCAGPDPRNPGGRLLYRGQRPLRSCRHARRP